MDPFNTAIPIQTETLTTQLRFIAPSATQPQITAYLSPASPRDLLIRSAHNIINSTTHHTAPPTHRISIHSANYAAIFALVLFPTHPATLQPNINELTQHFLQHFESDMSLFRNYILPLTTSLPDGYLYRNMAQEITATDLKPPTPKLRSTAPDHPVLYKVGQIFRHRRQGYLAAITGWDSKCEMVEQWISMHQVDSLPKGRNQPFYNVLVDDESTRYVAQENIIPLTDQQLSEHQINGFPIEIGKWFKRYDKDRGVFVSNVRDEYPED